MKVPKLEKTLTAIGLNDKEASVYLAALSLGPAPVARISTYAGIKRTTAYSVIESLKSKGIISEQVSGFKTRYAAAPPQSLHNLISSQLSALEESMPEFSALYNLPGDQAVIKHYEGLPAIKGLYEDLLASVGPNQDYLVLTDLYRWQKLDARFFALFARRRARKQVRLRMLTVHSKSATRSATTDEYAGRLRVLPEGMAITTNLIVTPQSVVFHQLEPPVDAIVLNNKSVIHMHKEMFEVIWQATKP
jgi:sugar-specific transcriptional regulator TrmB